MSNQATVRQYRDDDLLWWWEVSSRRGVIVGRSLRGYTRKVNCSTNMHRVGSALTPPIRWTQ